MSQVNVNRKRLCGGGFNLNIIDQERFEKATDLFWDGASVREVSRAVGMAKETAHRIQRIVKNGSFEFDGHWLRCVGGRSQDKKKRLRLVISAGLSEPLK